MMVKNLIIEAPRSQSFIQRYTSLAFTALLWFLWGYMWAPAVIITFNAFEVDIPFGSSQFTYDAFVLFLGDLEVYFIYIAIYCLIFFLWVNYNIFRFRDGCRYRPEEFLTVEQQSFHSKLSKEILEQSQGTKVLTASFNDNDEMVGLQALIRENKRL